MEGYHTLILSSSCYLNQLFDFILEFCIIFVVDHLSKSDLLSCSLYLFLMRCVCREGRVYSRGIID